MNMLVRIYPYEIRTWIDRLALVNKPPDRNCLIFYDNIAFKCHMFTSILQTNVYHKQLRLTLLCCFFPETDTWLLL